MPAGIASSTVVVLYKEEKLRSLQCDVERIMEIHGIIRARWPRFARALFQGEQVMRRVRRRMKDSDITTINILLADMNAITQRVMYRQQEVALCYPDLVDKTDAGLQKYYSTLQRISSYIQYQKNFMLLAGSALISFGICVYITIITLQGGISALDKLPWFFVHIGGALLICSSISRFFFRNKMLQDVIEDIIVLSKRNPIVSVTFLGWVAYDKSREAHLVRSVISSVLFLRPSH